VETEQHVQHEEEIGRRTEESGAVVLYVEHVVGDHAVFLPA